MRDAIIRKKAYAFAWGNTTGATRDPETIQAAYQEAFHEEIFKVEWQYLRGLLDDETLEEQSKAGYDQDLSYYLEALAGYYCNRLLNLADGGERGVCDETSWTYKRLKESSLPSLKPARCTTSSTWHEALSYTHSKHSRWSTSRSRMNLPNGMTKHLGC